MPTETRCQRCGAQRPEDGPSGLCPGCLLRLSLDVARPARPDGPRTGLRILGGSRGPGLSRSSGLLDGLAETVGPVPRVLLREEAAGAPEPVRPRSETMPEAADAPGRYQFFGELARGGMGVVLLGRDVDLGRDLAVKVQPERHRDDPDAVRRFIEEAQIAGQLQHPGIVPVHELGRLPDGRLYIAMTLVRGRTLAALLEARSSPAEDQPRFLAVFEQVCRAMAYTHTRGVIHRDLKPSNLMVGSFGEVQVMDWGLAKVLDQVGAAGEVRPPGGRDDVPAVRTARNGSDDSGSRTGSILGTPAYMAPEQARGALDTLDERADVFGLGSILCEILTGAPAFTGQTSEVLLGKAAGADLDDARARLDACDADGELVDLARSCLSPAARDRPRDAGAVLASLTAYLSGVQKRVRDAELAQAQAEARAVEERGRRLLADELARVARARAASERKRRVLTVALAASVLATAGLAGGGWAWMAHERSARALKTAAEIEAGLDAATLAREQARSSPAYAPRPWIEATEAARRAVFLAARGEGDPALDRRAQTTLSAIVAERRRVEAAERDRRMVERLTKVHADVTFHLDRDMEDAQYAAAFLEYGIDVDALSVDDAAARIAGRPIAVELAGALDHWAFSRRRARPVRLAEAQHLVDIARKADPDPWRDRLRDALDLMTADRTRALAELEALAESAEVETLTAASAERLAWALANLGSRTRAVGLYREAQRAHPDDFWINSNLASELVKVGQFGEAVRFASVAVAIRPQSSHALVALGKALHLAGRLRAAKATLRQAVRLQADNKDAHEALDAVQADMSREEGGEAREFGTEKSSEKFPPSGNVPLPDA